MANSNHLFHIHRHKRGRRKRHQGLDQTMLALSFIQPMTAIPQAMDVWGGGGQVSVITWSCFFVGGAVALAYGIVHRITPLIVANVLWLFIDAVIIIGALCS